jgi:hypothetical protein
MPVLMTVLAEDLAVLEGIRSARFRGHFVVWLQRCVRGGAGASSARMTGAR